jgi:anti-sigma B factor antagonist
MAFAVNTEMKDGIAILTLSGELDAAAAGDFRAAVEQAAQENPWRMVLMLEDLTFMASAGLRVLVFTKQKMGANVDLYIVGAHDAVLETIQMTGFHHSVIMLDSYDAAEIESA